ncbi:MAG TPA: type II secretion system protein GspL [Sphingomicrobium sp.]|nr:type II secretion system protein GspL [Sphingomicrobium sp.]
MTRERASPAALLVALPHDPVGGESTTHWWRVVGDRVEAGAGSEWLALAADLDARLRVIGLAPSALVRLTFSIRPEGASSPRQAATIARMGALEQSLGDPETLHSATVLMDDDPPTMVTAVAANSKMQEWLDWAEGLSVRIDHIVPVAMVLPLGDQWAAATIGSERILGRRGMVLPDEPSLKDALLGEERPDELEPDAIALALVRLAQAPEPDLRTGRFARRRRLVIERRKVRELALLTLAVVLMSTLIAVVEIVKLDASTSALDSETLVIAQKAAGPSVTLDNAEAALALRAGPAGGASLSSGIAAVLARLQPEPSVSLSMLGYSGDTLSFTVSGQDPGAINRLLLAFRRDGYRVSAVPTSQGDGRVLTEVTLRKGP